MSFSTLMMALGGLGLLLLGMGMMTDGLKSAAGNKLHAFLERSTQTRFRAACTGFGITAIVQSSSAVIVTTLGFTNAGMLRLRQAAWVVFGSNLGTTMTAWIVALIGLKLRVEVVALPLIGIGMLLKLIMRSGRAPHIGVALAGFGVLFLGLGLLRDSFEGVAEWIPVEQLGAAGAWGIVLGVLVGALLTALIQSSSAALAIILTASVTGVFTPLLGAALVIGANLGTTSTSLLTTIGATTNARRLAMVHVAEKIVTGTIALILLVPMWWIASWLVGGDGRTNISTGLALYHTLFNVLGLILMAFFADHLLRAVERWIKQPELTSEKPRYLDDTVLQVPAMGVAAMHSEIKRVFKQLLVRGRKLVDASLPMPDDVDDVNTSVLLNTIEQFGTNLANQNLEGVSEQFINVNWALQECRQLRENLHELSDFSEAELNSALTQELRECLLVFFGSGQLKSKLQAGRDAQLDEYKLLRRNQRALLLDGVNRNLVPAHIATKRLQIIALFEETAKLVLRIADVIYPDPQLDQDNANPRHSPD
ncbi:MAG: Na/Pi cotransporter family protein [Idiomarina sp.]|nr:Na/Pi cotransporter family protein [Idiomarina sp.]